MIEFILPLLPFSISTTLTPGPNNIMVTASGANFGYKQTIPHILGISFGLPLMIIVIGLGLGNAFQIFPIIHTLLRTAGASYLCYLAWQIAFFNNISTNQEKKTVPLSFMQAILFQWVNPKAWMMSIGAIATFTSHQSNILMEILLIALVFCLICIPCVSLWALLGVNIKHFLKENHHLKIFNITMASLLVVSLIMSFFF